MKVMLVEKGLMGIGLGSRLSRDGHDVRVAQVGEVEGGEGMVRKEKVLEEVRSVARAIKLMKAQKVIFCEPSLTHLMEKMEEKSGVEMFGMGREDKLKVEVEGDLEMWGRIRVGGKAIITWKGGGVWVRGGRCLAVAVRLGGGVEWKKDEGGFFYMKVRGRGMEIREERGVHPGVMGAILEMVKGDSGRLFTSPDLGLSSVALAIRVDGEGKEGKMRECCGEALKHVYVVKGKVEGEVMSGKGELGWVCAYGADIFEAGRRVYRTLERLKVEKVKCMRKAVGRLSGFFV